MKSNNIVEFVNVDFRYDLNNKVLDNVNFELDKSDFVGIKGYNGAGKTTFIKLILRILKQTSGEIFFSPEVLKNGIGYVRQNVDNSYNNFPASVLEIVMLGLYAKNKKFSLFNNSHKKSAMDALEKVDMSKYYKKRIFDLSGGQRQKVLIAKALVGAPNLLILDEPDSGIDEKSSIKLFEFLEELNNRENLTIIVISHNLEILEKYTKKIYRLKEGKLTLEKVNLI